jgi:hypothetical protein
MIPPTFFTLLVGFEMRDLFKMLGKLKGDLAPFDVIRGAS